MQNLIYKLSHDTFSSFFKEGETMGRIAVKIKVENAFDSGLAQRGQLAPEAVRSVELEALVDTGASLLCLPKSKIEALGLAQIGTRRVTTANGKVDREIYGDARLTVFNRICTVDVIALSEDTPPLLGYIPLENLDLVPDPTTETLNPAHGEEIVLDLY
jgi:predicted aspartyl protease